MIVGIDHIIVAVDELEEASEGYRRLGFAVHKGGEHPTYGTHNALVPLADGTYIELLAVRDRARAEALPLIRPIVAALDRPERLATFALESDDLERDVATLRARGLSIGEPSPGERLRPDGQTVRWRVAVWPDGDLPFLIQDVTERTLRISPPAEGLGSVTRMVLLTVGVRDMGRSLEIWRALLGTEPIENLLPLPRAAIRLEPADADLGPVCAELEVRARDLPPAVLRGRKRKEGGIELDPADTAGARLVLVGP